MAGLRVMISGPMLIHHLSSLWDGVRRMGSHCVHPEVGTHIHTRRTHTQTFAPTALRVHGQASDWLSGP